MPRPGIGCPVPVARRRRSLGPSLTALHQDGPRQMSHPEQQAFVGMVKGCFPAFFCRQRVLEVGSLDVNGSVRVHFEGCDYVGLDVGPGPGVDVVCQGQDYAAPDGSFDVAISCETMEHNPFWRGTLRNMTRLCRPGGLLVMTCAAPGRPEHGTRRTTPRDAPLIPWDYYHNLGASELRVAMCPEESFSLWLICVDSSFHDLYFVGFRSGGPVPPGAPRALRSVGRYYARKRVRVAFKNVVKAILVRVMGRQGFAEARRIWRRRRPVHAGEHDLRLQRGPATALGAGGFGPCAAGCSPDDKGPGSGPVPADRGRMSTGSTS